MQRDRDRKKDRRRKSRKPGRLNSNLRTKARKWVGKSGRKEGPYISWGDKHLRVNTLSFQIDRQTDLFTNMPARQTM